MILNQRRLGGAVPSAFDMAPLAYSTPGIGDRLPQNPPAEPFVWGAGGARLTPEQILAREELARNQMQADFSPVGHWTEGLGRVLNNAIGALDAKALDKESKAANADRAAMFAQMLGPDNADLAGAVSSGDKVLAGLAGDIMERRNPTPRNPFEFEQMLAAGGYQPGTPEYQQQVRSMITAKNDPFVTATLPTGDFFAGRQSAFGQYLKGGDPASGVVPGTVGSTPPANIPTAPVGKLTPIGGGSGNAVSPFPR